MRDHISTCGNTEFYQWVKDQCLTGRLTTPACLQEFETRLHAVSIAAAIDSKLALAILTECQLELPPSLENHLQMSLLSAL